MHLNSQAAMNRQTPQQRTETFIAHCQTYVDITSRNPNSDRMAGDRMLVALVHDGAELTCPTLDSWWIHEYRAVEVGGRYEMREIDGVKATYENRDVTILALLPISAPVA